MSKRTLAPRPNPLPKSEWLVSYCLRAPVFFLSTGFFGSLALIASLFDKDGKLQHAIAQRWGRAVIRISGSRLTVIGGEHLDGRSAVYAANHLSYTDTPVIFGALPFQFRIVARHELFKLPFIGWYLRRSGQLAVNVTNPRASIASMGAAVKTLKSGLPLFIFPEGGRSASGHLSTLLNGPAFMAIRAQVPIVPMALIGTYELLPIHTTSFHPMPLRLVVGEPIDTSGYSAKQVDELTKRLGETIAQLYYDHTYMKAPEKPEMEAVPVEREK